MDEVVKAICDHTFGFIRWKFSPANGGDDSLRKVYDSIDDYLIDKPGYRVTVTVERDPGLDNILPRLGLLGGKAEV